MNKKSVTLALLVTLVSTLGCNAMWQLAMEWHRPVKLFMDDPTVQLVIEPDYIITGEALNGAIFFAAHNDFIGIQFPGEDEPEHFNLELLGPGQVTIRINKIAPKIYTVELENEQTGERVIYHHGDTPQENK